ncbi:MAG: anti-sigma factor [Phycisphaerales bacterium]
MSTNAPSNYGLNGGTDPHDRLMDLLVADATEGLDSASRVELDRLIAANPGFDTEQFELAAAAAAVALIEPDMQRQGLPPAVRGRLNALAESFGSVQGGLGTDLKTERRTGLRIAGTPADRPVVQTRAPAAWLGWLAAAAALTIAAVGWYRAIGPQGATVPTPARTLAAQFEAFKKSADDAIHWPWAGKEPGYEGVKGEVYWSDRLQRGYMLLSGLAPNDPKVKQYQLWIVDPKRDKHPVDGGVFDIAQSPAAGDRLPTGEVVVPIDCKLRVESPAAFALTVEQPGGVVVSAGPLVVVAAK